MTVESDIAAERARAPRRCRHGASIGAALVVVTSFFALGACGGERAQQLASPTASTPSASAVVPPKEQKEMPKLPPIVQTGAMVLRHPAREVDAAYLATREFHDLVATMITVMRNAPGVGLAAPQIGVDLRVIVLEDKKELIEKISPRERNERLREPFPVRVLVNPKLTLEGTEKATFFEGCLSVQGYVGLVERSLEVTVRGLDESGAPQEWRVRGWPARILQHEVDHLDGTLYIDRMRTRSFSTQEHAKALYGGKPIDEVLKLAQ